MKRRNLMAVVLAGVMAASVMGCASQSGAKNPSETQKEAAKEGASNESVSKDNESGAADSAAVPAGSRTMTLRSVFPMQQGEPWTRSRGFWDREFSRARERRL